MGWRKGQPYSQDLRDRVLVASEEPIRSIAARLAVSPSYVSKVRARFRTRGEATPGPQHNQVPARLAPLNDALRRRVAEQADATIAELRTWVAREHGVTVSHPVMWKTLVQLGLTLKKTTARGRAGPCRRGRSPRRLVGPRTAIGCDQAGVS